MTPFALFAVFVVCCLLYVAATYCFVDEREP